MFQIRIDRVFSASHAIRLTDGSLEPVHGHNWPVGVVVEARRLDAMDTVMDFHVLEQALDSLLEGVNNRHLNEVAPFAGDGGEWSVNPTAERVAEWIGLSITKNLPVGVRLVRVEVGEAPGCTAIYMPAM